ncbi:CHAT domain-containing protein [Okeania sp. SIO1F9]|uniref:CHAT domain-containing protein n=1 Tax=Okeania sp. SIO1F9 TaxID=2607813 RepID=UPI00144C3D7A|nr:CHAT domain-containing protein [Okeania sp. SIO1F9]NET78223.1 CHAT domain-containing protein [Okeania sp. SIO1F9]
MLKVFLISSAFCLLPSALILGIQVKQVQAVYLNNNLVKKSKINGDVLTQALTISASNLELQAQKLFEKGDFSASIPLLEVAINNYATQGDNYSQIRALRNLGLVYLKLGKWQDAEAALNNCLNLIQQTSNLQKTEKITASVLEVKGQLKLSIGQAEVALDTWKEASQIYEKIDDYLGFTRSGINQAQALQALGLYSQAFKQLTRAKQNLEEQPDTIIKAKALQSLGDVLRGIGQLSESQKVLESSLVIAENLQATEEIAIILISLGNTAILLDNPQAANLFYQRAIQESPIVEIKTQAMLNQLNLSVEQKQYLTATELVTNIDDLLNQLSASQPGIYARINLAQNLIELRKEVFANDSNKPLYPPAKIADYLVTAVQQARSLEDARAESYGLGTLGTLYEHNQQWNEARELTEKALILAQSINAADISYQWEWQLGRILTVTGNTNEAIVAYSQSVKNLQALRSDIVAISSELKFDFRDSVEPIYRELVELLLEPSTPGKKDISQKNLKQARQVIEALQLAELDNFFRNACLDTKPVEVDRVDKNAAIFYTIILRDRLAVILAIPEKPLVYYSTNISREEIDSKIETMLTALTFPQKRIFIENYREPAAEVYKWLIHPAEDLLRDSQIKTLVFVLEGRLRSIPLASLYNDDSKEYVIQNYNVAIAPSLELIDPKPLARNKLEVLGMGITESRQGFPPLPNVRQELEDIQAQASSEILLNELFTENEANTEVADTPYQVIHIATHGEFSSNVEDTFILTWDDRINVEELRSMIKSGVQQTRPVELLVLSACRTATGDERATLGLAGVAVRAGARSTIASLWYVSDEATAVLMKNLYEQLTDSTITKAEALRRAQRKILRDAQIREVNSEFEHPYFWSTFVLVGNWL